MRTFEVADSRNIKASALKTEKASAKSDEQLNFILSLGNHGITRSAVLCVDFSEAIPYCIAMMLLYGAYTGQMAKQVIDAGDGANVDRLVEALTLLYPCCNSWECTIMHPSVIKIGQNKSASTIKGKLENENAPKRKNSFWAKIFGKKEEDS